jgi:hypothetical protein
VSHPFFFSKAALANIQAENPRNSRFRVTFTLYYRLEQKVYVDLFAVMLTFAYKYSVLTIRLVDPDTPARSNMILNFTLLDMVL